MKEMTLNTRSEETNSSLVETAYEHIRAQLISGQLSPGARLVNRKLANQIGMSFTPVREAINRLASQGMVEQIPGAGAFVRKLTRQEIIDIYGLREAVEPYAASEAAKKIDARQLAALEAILAEWTRIIELARESGEKSVHGQTLATWIAGDIRFHEIIIDATQNQFIKKTLTDLNMLRRMFAAKPAELPEKDAITTHESHAKLVECLKNRDSEGAHQWMKSQIRVGLGFVLDHLNLT